MKHNLAGLWPYMFYVCICRKCSELMHMSCFLGSKYVHICHTFLVSLFASVIYCSASVKDKCQLKFVKFTKYNYIFKECFVKFTFIYDWIIKGLSQWFTFSFLADYTGCPVHCWSHSAIHFVKTIAINLFLKIISRVSIL